VDAQVRASLEQSFNAESEVNSSSMPETEISSEAIDLEDRANGTSLNQPAISAEHNSEGIASADFWASQLSRLSNELKHLLHPVQISSILTQPDPIAAIQALQAAQPLFAAVYEELADFYLSLQSSHLASNSLV
jgi:hypothetical protein